MGRFRIQIVGALNLYGMTLSLMCTSFTFQKTVRTEAQEPVNPANVNEF
jgi:hypothetical protein